MKKYMKTGIMIFMRQTNKILILLIPALLCGCASSSSSAAENTVSPSAEASVSSDPFNRYQERISSIPERSSWTASVKEDYDMHFSDDTDQAYTLDGVIEMDEEQSMAHVTQNINANGLASVLEGYYESGRLYNSYNGVTYYEDMTVSDVQSSLLVPMTPIKLKKEQIESIDVQESEGTEIYTAVLNADAAESILNSRYDIYGLSQYEDYKVSSGTITVSFDKDGNCIGETSAFSVSLTQDSLPVTIDISTEMNIIRINSTEIEITDEQKSVFETYVNYTDIDTDAIQTLTSDDDSAEATVTDTFKKRLVSRLGYESSGNNLYSVTFNTSEGYEADFGNMQFTYSNYSIAYIYNWKSDTGVHDSCTYSFADEKASADCDDTIIQSLKDAKSDLQMELYYCGLSLQDLQLESQ